jgi:hypothetical protein
MRPLNSGLPEFSNIIVQVGNSRLGWRRPGIQHHAPLRIPGSRGRRAPRNDGIEQARHAGLFCFGLTCAIEGEQPFNDGEPAMRIWIGAITLMALLAIGDAGTIGAASAAKVIAVPQRTQLAPQRTQLAPERYQRAYRDDRTGYGRYDHSRYDHSPYDQNAYDRSAYGGWTYYYGRPYFYAPAPFPLGFDFGFGWW